MYFRIRLCDGHITSNMYNWWRSLSNLRGSLYRSVSHAPKFVAFKMYCVRAVTVAVRDRKLVYVNRTNRKFPFSHKSNRHGSTVPQQYAMHANAIYTELFIKLQSLPEYADHLEKTNDSRDTDHHFLNIEQHNTPRRHTDCHSLQRNRATRCQLKSCQLLHNYIKITLEKTWKRWMTVLRIQYNNGVAQAGKTDYGP